MKTKIQSILIIFILISITIIFILIPKDIIKSINFSISIWKDTLLPSLFPFFMISDLLIQYGFIELIGELLKNKMNKIFHLPGEASFVLIGSIITGFPSSSKYIYELLENNLINEKEASYLLKFNHFSNPLFVIGTVGTLLLNNKNLGYLILVIHILSNFIIAFIFRPRTTKSTNTKVSLRTAINKMHKKRVNNSSFPEILNNSIFKSFKTLLLLLGVITTFVVINSILCKIFNLNIFLSSLLGGILEMSNGIKSISSINIPTNIKASIITFFLSFGGLSIHMQVMSILSDTNIKYLPYLFARILHAFISSSIIYVLLSII